LQATNELIAEHETYYTSLQEKYARGKIEEDFYDVERGRVKQLLEQFSAERQKWEDKLQELTISDAQIRDIEAIGKEITEATEEISFARKRKILEKMSVNGTITREEPDGRVLYLSLYIHSWRIPLDTNGTPKRVGSAACCGRSRSPRRSAASPAG